MNEQQFSELIGRYQAGTCSQEEKQAIEKWLELRGDLDLYSTLSQKERAEMSERVYRSLKAARKPASTAVTFPLWLRTLAAAVFLVAFGYLGWRMIGARTGGTLEVVATDAIRKTLLPDGSIVWLKSDSKLTYPQAFEGNERNVTLAGEALFEVVQDSAHPFIITCGTLRATVLGTSFNIRASTENIEVTVLTGMVNLSSASDPEGIAVVRGEKAVYHAGRQIVKKASPVDEKKTITEGTEYDMHFEATEMSEILRRIEGKFNVKINTDQADINRFTITADLTDRSLEDTFSVMSDILDFEYEIKGNTIYIRGGGKSQHVKFTDPAGSIQ